MQPRIAGTTLAALLLCAGGGAYAHEWYPRACCLDVDCAPLKDGTVLWSPAGWRVLETGETIPEDDSRERVSPDRHFHRCRLEFWDTRSGTRCLFVPEPDG